MMLVKDVMTTRVKTALPDTTLRDVAILMVFYHISGLPVVDENHTLRGVISEKDVLRAMYPKVGEAMKMAQMPRFEDLEHEYRDVLDMPTSTYMTESVFTVGPEDPILRAVAEMFAHKIRRIPVAIAGKLVGILSIGDVHKAVLRKTFDSEFAENAEHGAAGSS
ncbi:MAG: CBS domain-containing protein [Acidiferrobacteraceae bacterium]